MNRYIEKNIEDKLANLIIDAGDKSLYGIALSVKDNEIVIDTM